MEKFAPQHVDAWQCCSNAFRGVALSRILKTVHHIRDRRWQHAVQVTHNLACWKFINAVTGIDDLRAESINPRGPRTALYAILYRNTSKSQAKRRNSVGQLSVAMYSYWDKSVRLYSASSTTVFALNIRFPMLVTCTVLASMLSRWFWSSASNGCILISNPALMSPCQHRPRFDQRATHNERRKSRLA